MQACCGEAEGMCPFAAAAAAALLLLQMCLSALAVCGESSWLRPYGVSAVIQSPEQSNQHRSNKQQQQQQQQPPAFSHSAPPGFDSGAALAAAPTAAAASDSASAADEPVAPPSATVASSGSSASSASAALSAGAAAAAAGARREGPLAVQPKRGSSSNNNSSGTSNSARQASSLPAGSASSVSVLAPPAAAAAAASTAATAAAAAAAAATRGPLAALGHVPSFYYDADPSEPQQQQEQQQQQQQRVGSPQQQQKQQDLLISRRSSRISYNDATRNFADSLAAYAVLSYLLQVKDRHNGNVLVSHSSGRLLHVDVGFVLELSPGGDLAFERAPFELTAEMAALLSTEQGVLFKAFSSKCIRGAWFPGLSSVLSLSRDGVSPSLSVSLSPVSIFPVLFCLRSCFFLCLRETADDLVFLLEALQLARLQLQLSPLQAAAFMEAKIREALQSFTTRAYDVVQHLQQGIAH
ncbi:hypothetical protein Efla_007505 [Eimeria flavescens]